MEQGLADSQRRLELEIAILRQRLEDAEEMRRAITAGNIDGFVIGERDDDQRVALLDLALPRYGEILHRIEQGATTVSRTGQILYANQRFATLVGESLCDLVVVVACSPDLQRERLMARSRLSAEQADAMIQSQMPLSEKSRQATHVVWNNDGPGPLSGQASMLVLSWKA